MTSKLTTHIGLIAAALLTFACGGTSSATRTSLEPFDGGEGGENAGGSAAILETGGNSSGTSGIENTGGNSGTGGSSGVENTSGNSGEPETGGNGNELTGGSSGSGNTSGSGGSSGQYTGGTSGQNTGATGATITGGVGGENPGGAGGEIPAGGLAGSGGEGNTGGNCEPWDCTNIGIHMYGWDPNSGEQVPEICGFVEDPCTGMIVDCNGCEGTTPLYDTTDEPVLTNNCGMRAPTRDEAIQDMHAHSQIDWESKYNSGSPNLCQPSCVYVNSYINERCDTNELIFICSTENTTPNSACRPSQEEPAVSSIYGHEWCCPRESEWE